MPRPKRSKMEIYNAVLSAIRLELVQGEVRPTKVQSKSNLAYDKLVRYLGELEASAMITQSPLMITQKGRDFLDDYDRIEGFLEDMGVKYLALPRRFSS